MSLREVMIGSEARQRAVDVITDLCRAGGLEVSPEQLADQVLAALAGPGVVWVPEMAQSPPPQAPRPQHALVLIGSSANAESAESTLFVRDLQSEAVFKIQGVRV